VDDTDAQQHPNEYIRGATLRFLQKIRESELLEPLVPTVRSCLVSTASRQLYPATVGGARS
jgi:vesicle coat complex subunit